MTDDELDKLELEVIKGRKAEQAYENFVKPFVAEKEQVCFEAFKTISVKEIDDLVEIKRQLMAIEALDAHITSIIDTGKMAGRAIAEENKRNDDSNSRNQ